MSLIWVKLGRHGFKNALILEGGLDADTAELTAHVFAYQIIRPVLEKYGTKRIAHIAVPKSIPDALYTSALYLLGHKDHVPEYIEGFPLVVGKAISVALEMNEKAKATVLKRALKFGVGAFVDAMTVR